MEVLTMVGFLDGINESLKTPNNLEELTETREVSLDYDDELLYKNMVEAKATGFTVLKNGMTFLMQTSRRNYIKSRNYQAQYLKIKKSAEMTHVHVEVEKI